MRPLRILFLADSHLGFDLPARPRLSKRRRGHDFLDNYQSALAPAFAGEVDMVVHGGDVFDFPFANSVLAYHAFEPLRRIADAGVPVIIVPGNHERGRLPHLRFARHPNVHVFDRPRTFFVECGDMRVGLSGFPYERRNVRGRFPELLAATQWGEESCTIRLLCVHHCIEGATVGPQNFIFRYADDVIRINDVPADFAAVLSGHIHRHQVLTRDLRGREVAVPVFYPGSIERTAYAEMGEEKGFLLLTIEDERQVRWKFEILPTRPLELPKHRPDKTTQRFDPKKRPNTSKEPSLFDV